MAKRSTGKRALLDRINVVNCDITEMDVDAIVNAANGGLAQGGGVCGAIFKAAGPDDMRQACDKYGRCETGDAVITPGFALKAQYVIHAVGPRWKGGGFNEEEMLSSCYSKSLDLARANDCHSIAFPLISSGIFEYPKPKAWRVALESCAQWLAENKDSDMRIAFCVTSDKSLELGESTRNELMH